MEFATHPCFAHGDCTVCATNHMGATSGPAARICIKPSILELEANLYRKTPGSSRAQIKRAAPMLGAALFECLPCLGNSADYGIFLHAAKVSGVGKEALPGGRLHA